MGGWKMIYPCEDRARNTVYDGFVRKANDLWDEFTTGNKAKNKQMHLERRPPGPPKAMKPQNK
jgi:hypothetical protein